MKGSCFHRTAILWRLSIGKVLRSKTKRKRDGFLGKMSRRIHPAFQSKTVVKLECKYCERSICARGMRALLLADTKVELYSTDLPPEKWVQNVFKRFRVKYVLSFSTSLHSVILSTSFFSSIQLIGTDYSTPNCECRIKDVACLGWCVAFVFHAEIAFYLFCTCL